MVGHALSIIPEIAAAPQKDRFSVRGIDAATYLELAEKSTLLRFSTAGSVDDGKSTFIGRLLYDTANLYADTLRSVEKTAKESGDLSMTLALLTDGLHAEREQGITIDVAYRYFSTPKRRFILADSPGHEQYTRNMATGASTADLTIILVDARKGILTQTKRHAFIASLLGVPRLVVAVNKMDLMDYSEKVFELIKQDFSSFATRLGVHEIRFVPVSALMGDNVVFRSENMPWYRGETVMDYLENVFVAGDTNAVDFRFPVQYVIRPHQNYRGYAGQIRSGAIRVGEEVMALPSGKRTRVKGIDVFRSETSLPMPEFAHAPHSVTLTLEDEIDIARGDMLVRPMNVPHVTSEFDAMLIWMSEHSMDVTKSYIISHTSRQTKARIERIDYRVDVNSLHRTSGAPLALNEVGRIRLMTQQPLFLDAYTKNRETGNFILIDPETFLTVAAGMVIERSGAPAEAELEQDRSQPKSKHLHIEQSLVQRDEREAKAGGRAITFWFTGLSGSGKSTIAKALERELFDAGRLVYRLDGDNLRRGLNSDLGFSKEDRSENIRRTAEVAKLLNDAGITVICALISPLNEDRERARTIIGSNRFLEVYINTPLEVCESRDPHGMYQKARRGEIKEFTGVTAPYEAPVSPAIELDSSRESVAELVLRVTALIDSK